MDRNSEEVSNKSLFNESSIDVDQGNIVNLDVSGSLDLTGATITGLTNFDLSGTLTTDFINEHTANAGVNIDGVLLKDNNVSASSISVNYDGTLGPVPTGHVFVQNGQFYGHNSGLYCDNDVNCGTGLYNGVDIQALEGTVNALTGIGLGGLTIAEVNQLKNIDTSTFSSAQWTRLSNINQDITTTSNVSFGQITSSNVLDIVGGRTIATDGANIDSLIALGLLSLTPTEVSQLAKIDGASFTSAQWLRLAQQDQDVRTTSSPSFVNISVSGNVDGRDVSADGATLDNLNTTIGLGGLTTAEVNQLKNIDTSTFSAAQWTRLSNINQDLTTTSSATFAGLTTNGNITVTGNVDGVDVSSFKTDYDSKVNQDVRSSAAPTFTGLTVNGGHNVWNNNEINFFTNSGVTLQGYIGNGLNTDLTLKSSSSSKWLRIGANASNIAFWMNNNVDVDNTPQISFSSATGSINIAALTASTLIATDASKNLTSSVSSLSPTFAGLTINGNITITGNVDGVDVSSFKTDYDSKVNQDVRSSASPTFTALSLTTGTKALNFAANLGNRKIVLHPTVDNDHQYYGMGINAFILRYQVDSTGSDHVFYAATSSTASNEVFRIKGTGGANSTGSVIPSATTTYDLGGASNIWRYVYGGNFFAGDGSVGSPGYLFLNDQNTGIYRIGNDNLGISCGGVKQLDITTSAFTTTNKVTTPNVVLTDYSASNDFYATGTWTPTMGDGTNQFTYGSRGGTWTRIGRITYFTLSVAWTGKGSASGNIRVSLSSTLSSDHSFTVGTCENVTFASQLTAYGFSGTSYLIFYNTPSNATPTALTNTQYGTSGYVNVSGFYH